MGKLFAVGLGGAIGSIARYIIALISERWGSIHFPLGTLAVNILGSLLIGFCWSYFEKTYISYEFRLFLFTGFLGGFTTFSTFTRETVQFLKADEPYHAMGYLLLSNMAGLTAVACGFFVAYRWLR